MELIDTHAHIDFDSYNEDREEMMKRAFDTGVKTIVHPCCRANEMEELANYSKVYTGDGSPNLYYAIGVHPCETESWDNSIIEQMEKHLTDNFTGKPESKLKAIGETGLDYFHGKTEEALKIQHKAFRAQIAIAQKHKLPLIIHTRDCFDDTLKVLQEFYPKDRDARAGVLHCYTGDAAFGLACIELGFYVSWSGILTFKKSELPEVAKQIPLDRTLIETDCPFLAPQAQRGKRNEPSFVNHVADLLAELRDISKEELAKITTANAKTLFSI